MEHYHGNEYHDNCLRLNSARNCLRYIIKSKKIKEIYLPLLLCDTIYEVCIEEKVKIKYYNIDKQLKPIIPKIKSNSYIYLINYYGLLSNKYIKKIYNEYKNLIVDNTQSFFQKPINNRIDTLYSCRKYFGVSDGAYLYTNKYLNEKMNKDISSTNINYLLKRYETNAKDNYELFLANENRFLNKNILEMSKITQNILKSINYKRVLKQRKENFNYLNKELKDINQIEINNNKGYFMYPLLLDNSEKIKKKLIDNNIYIPTLWPYFEKNEQLNEANEIYLTQNILPLPCDHRYNISDMKKIIDIVKDIMLS